jgi:hypothetical protein
MNMPSHPANEPNRSDAQNDYMRRKAAGVVMEPAYRENGRPTRAHLRAWELGREETLGYLDERVAQARIRSSVVMSKHRTYAWVVAPSLVCWTSIDCTNTPTMQPFLCFLCVLQALCFVSAAKPVACRDPIVRKEWYVEIWSE